MDQPDAWCPQCGTARQGEFRYCSKCGFDFAAVRDAAPRQALTVLTVAAVLAMRAEHRLAASPGHI